MDKYYISSMVIAKGKRVYKFHEIELPENLSSENIDDIKNYFVDYCKKEKIRDFKDAYLNLHYTTSTKYVDSQGLDVEIISKTLLPKKSIKLFVDK